MNSAKPKYNTWIRKKRIAIFSLVALLLIAASVSLLQASLVISSLLLALGIPFVYITYVLVRTYYLFSFAGGDYQARIHDIIVSSIVSKKGKLLDIGTGSGLLTIKAAKKLQGVTATGIDYWGNDWDYSKKLCEDNAKIEGVADRLDFVRASASKLPFADSSFDIVISCLTFHEVKDEADKTKVISEALRVLKDGGEFVFMDLFSNEQVFGEVSVLVDSLGVSKIEITRLDELIKLPKILLSNKSLGDAMLIRGIK